MKINWKVRLTNPYFYMQLTLAFITPIFAYYGITMEDMTTFPALFEVVKQALLNPCVDVAITVSIFNAIIDPTTKGIGDSVKALTYTKPK